MPVNSGLESSNAGFNQVEPARAISTHPWSELILRPARAISTHPWSELILRPARAISTHPWSELSYGPLELSQHIPGRN